MGTFEGHALPGGIFVANSAVFLIRAHRDFLLPKSQNFSYLIFITEIALNFVVPLIGIILVSGLDSNIIFWVKAIARGDFLSGYSITRKNLEDSNPRPRDRGFREFLNWGFLRSSIRGIGVFGIFLFEIFGNFLTSKIPSSREIINLVQN